MKSSLGAPAAATAPPGVATPGVAAPGVAAGGGFAGAEAGGGWLPKATAVNAALNTHP